MTTKGYKYGCIDLKTTPSYLVRHIVVSIKYYIVNSCLIPLLAVKNTCFSTFQGTRSCFNFDKCVS